MRRAGLTWDGDPRVKPPFGAAEVDWGHPLTASLITRGLLNESGGPVYGLGQVVPVLAPTAIIRTVGPKGTGCAFDGTSSYLKGALGILPSGDVTVGAWVRTPAALINNYPQIGSLNGDASGVNGLNLYLYRPSAQNQFSFIVKTGGEAWGNDWVLTPAGFVQPSTDYFVCGVRSGATMLVYVDGVLQGTDVGTAGAITYDASPTLQLGTKQSASVPTDANWSGIIYDYVLLNAAINSSEMLQLHVEPYAMLRPRVPRRYFVPAAAGGMLPYTPLRRRRRRRLLT